MIGRLNLFLAVATVGSSFLNGVNAQLTALGSSDLGTPNIAGSHTGSGSDWSVTAAGTDIWGSSDQGHFLYFPRDANTTDVMVTCKVESFPEIYSWQKGGIMFRETLVANSKHHFIAATGHGYAHQYRASTGGGSNNPADDTSRTYSETPWLRLVKIGNTITSYVKQDGEYDWLKVHSHSVWFADDFYVGLAATSHEYDQTVTLTVSNLEITTVPEELYTQDDYNGLMEIGDDGAKIKIQQVAEGVFNTWGAGNGIGGASDSFLFNQATHTGDVVATMYLDKLERKNANTKGGLMIRAGLEADAPHVSLLVQSNTGVTMFSRTTAGGDTESLNEGVWEERLELKLTKVGNTVTCSYRPKGISGDAPWYELGSATVEFGAGDFYVGKAHASAEHDKLVCMTTGHLDVQPYVA